MEELPSAHAADVHALLSLSTEPLGYLSRSMQEVSALRLPTVEQLGQLLDLAFFTSLQPEEGRPVRFSMCWIPPSSADWSYRLVPPVSASVPALAKIAPSTEPDTSALLIGASARAPMDFEIWGVMTLPDGPEFASPMQWPGHHWPEQLYVKVTAVGAIELRLFSEIVFTYVRGHGVIHDAAAMGEKEIHKKIPQFRPRPAVARELELRELVPLVRAMRAHGNGGCLLIVPKRETAAGIDFKYRVKDWNLLENARERITHAKTSETQSLETMGAAKEMRDFLHIPTALAERVHRRILRAIGRMTAVDGATVLTWSGQLLGYGAKFSIRPGNGETEVLHINPRNRQQQTRKLNEVVSGNRHTSAAAACRECGSGTMAAVASQDGDLTLVGWQGDQLVVVRPIGSF